MATSVHQHPSVSSPAASQAEDAGERLVELEGRSIRYTDVGQGPPLVFVHGVWATGGLWDPVVDLLATRFRCIVPTLPLGAHSIPSPPEVDHSPLALARLIAALLEKLDLRDVTLVGNDTGGAICQLVIAYHADRVGRLVLTNCDALEMFPPRILKPLYLAARSRAVWWALAQTLRIGAAQRAFFATVAHTPPDPALLEKLLKRFYAGARVREDLRLTICAIAPRVTIEASRHFKDFSGEVLLVWGTDDPFFPVSLARRLAATFQNARLQLVEGSRLFVAVDAPLVLATAISDFVASTAVK